MSYWWRDFFGLYDIFRGVTSCKINVGDTVLIWKDVWKDNTTMQESLPRLFSYVLQEDMSAQEFLALENIYDAFALPLSMEANDHVADLQHDLCLGRRRVHDTETLQVLLPQYHSTAKLTKNLENQVHNET
jgi:hypothetical protein